MGSITTYKNQPIEIPLMDDVRDNGWVISSGSAIHSACNSGMLTNTSIQVMPGQDYTISYKVDNITSGVVYVIIGGNQGQIVSSSGVYTDTLEAIDSTGVSFYSDGNLRISEVKISMGQVAGVTVSFNENMNKWVSYLSYEPEFMAKFLDQFLTFKQGYLWVHHTNPIRNNFYGQQYTSRFVIYSNIDPTEVKNYHNIRIKGNKAWSVIEAKIDPREGKQNGQRSRIKKGNFKVLQGDFFAAFMKDMNDPRFDNELVALTKGADLQGGVMQILLENTDTSEVRLLSVDIEVSPQQYTY